jgi:hypothetical protein
MVLESTGGTVYILVKTWHNSETFGGTKNELSLMDWHAGCLYSNSEFLIKQGVEDGIYKIVAQSPDEYARKLYT